MKFTVNRKILYEYLKSMIRVIPSNSPMPELRCFLMECSEEDGQLCVTANNMESAIMRKFKVDVESEGGFLILARLLLDISERLGSDDVIFEEVQPGLVKITNGTTIYHLPTLPGRNYPKPDMPFPDDVLKVTGICDLYARTANAVSSDSNKPALTGIHLDIYSDSIRAVTCDSHRLALSNKSSDCGGKLSVTIPKQSFYHLACAVSNDDVLEVGLDGGSVIFMMKGLLFSARCIPDQFIDPEILIRNHDRCYSANVEMDEMHNAIDAIVTIASQCGQSPKIQLQFMQSKINFNIEGEDVGFNVDVSATVSKVMDKPFFYPAYKFADLLKTVKGKAVVEVASGGLLMITDEHNQNQYIVLNTRAEIKQASQKKHTKKAA